MEIVSAFVCSDVAMLILDYAATGLASVDINHELYTHSLTGSVYIKRIHHETLVGPVGVTLISPLRFSTENLLTQSCSTYSIPTPLRNPRMIYTPDYIYVSGNVNIMAHYTCYTGTQILWVDGPHGVECIDVIHQCHNFNGLEADDHLILYETEGNYDCRSLHRLNLTTLQPTTLPVPQWLCRIYGVCYINSNLYVVGTSNHQCVEIYSYTKRWDLVGTLPHVQTRAVSYDNTIVVYDPDLWLFHVGLRTWSHMEHTTRVIHALPINSILGIIFMV